MLTTKNHGTLIPKKSGHVKDGEIRKMIFVCVIGDCTPTPILTAPESNHVKYKVYLYSLWPVLVKMAQ